VLAVGGDKSFGLPWRRHARSRTNVTELVILNSGHWLMEEQPARRSPQFAPSSIRTAEHQAVDFDPIPRRKS